MVRLPFYMVSELRNAHRVRQIVITRSLSSHIHLSPPRFPKVHPERCLQPHPFEVPFISQELALVYRVLPDMLLGEIVDLIETVPGSHAVCAKMLEGLPPRVQ